MGNDQPSQRRTSSDNRYCYVPSTTSNYQPTAIPVPPPRPQPPQNSRPQPQATPSSSQQNVHQQTAATQNRIYPTLDPQPRNTTLDFYQRHINMNQPTQGYVSPSAPPECIVNNNHNIPTNSATNHHSRPQRQQNKNKNNANCPTCERPYGIRIFQCLGGHSCCEDCKSKIKSCGLCGQSIGSMRNFSLEECIGGLKVPCPSAGCSLTIKKIEMEEHLKECPLVERPCPLQTMHHVTCHWKGKLSELGAHFDVVHPDNRRADVGTEMIINNVTTFINISHHFTYLITLGYFNFLLHVAIKMNEKISMAVQFCGTNVSANKWTYEFHVYNKQDPRKKYLYTDSCQSYHVPMNDIFKNGAVLPMDYARTFVNSDSFTYKVFIRSDGSHNKRDNPHSRGRGRGRGASRGNRSTSACSNATN